MERYWLFGFGIVFGIAVLKTVLVVTLVLTPEQAAIDTITGLFALFFALTSGVGYLCYGQFKSYAESQRKKRIASDDNLPVAKETVIARYAPTWGLSQSEADVAIFVAKGFSNNEIAEMRGSALATVKSQLGSIYQKSGLDSRYQLISFVADEVCEMAKDQDSATVSSENTKIATRQILPLPGRAASTGNTRRQA